uniref:Uncharacterized protein n=1 Tax=Magnetococcus massalia (strain MO-1) TaxID=451514 RepID=A0A1S7LQR9_MAGMO|nr:Conserved protein of unknown function [Candidatus Magnetococcus massalia]
MPIEYALMSQKHRWKKRLVFFLFSPLYTKKERQTVFFLLNCHMPVKKHKRLKNRKIK